MDRTDVITLAESLGLLYPEPMDYTHPAQMRLISKLEKFAMECFDNGYQDGCTETILEERGQLKFLGAIPKSILDFKQENK